MQTNLRETDFKADIEAVQKIPIIATLLDVICRTTGMGFAAVARVTEGRWITCSVLDKINFGLTPGDELNVQTTICHEIQQNNKPVVIDDVVKDAVFCSHATPQLYGFQSYISMPIIRKDGRFFGTLCAIDPKPARLNTPEMIGMFQLFSDLIAFHLNAVEQLEQSEAVLLKVRDERLNLIERKNAELQKMNSELESFAYVASHDLQEPLRKIHTFSNLIHERDYASLSPDGKRYFDRLEKSVTRMQSLIKDLIMYTQVKVHEQAFEKTPLHKLVDDIKQSYSEELAQKQVVIDAADLGTAYIIPFQFSQLLQNLISNAVKFSKPGVAPVIRISGGMEKGNPQVGEALLPEKNYYHLSVSDNGIGFDPQYKQRIFEVFQRLNGREEFEGTGVGLSIVKKIVDNHNGFITATGEVNGGATFDIYLPQP